jgi:hypothetical protein
MFLEYDILAIIWNKVYLEWENVTFSRLKSFF